MVGVIVIIPLGVGVTVAAAAGDGYLFITPVALPGITWILLATSLPSSFKSPTAAILCPTARSANVAVSMFLILITVRLSTRRV